MKRTTLLKKMITDPEILVMPGIHDGVSALLAKRSGCRAVCLGGYGATATLLGMPDISLLSLTEMAAHLSHIADAVDLPILVDADTGHGDILNVVRTVRELEKAGAAGLFIEDQVFPKRCGHMEGKRVIDAADMADKLKAALDTRKDPDFVIMARTDVYAVSGLEAAVKRGNLYGEVGADIVFIEAPSTVEDMRRINAGLHVPSVANMVEGGKTPLLSAAELQEIGYSSVIFPVSALYASALAMEKVFQSLAQNGTTEPVADQIMPFGDFNEVVNLKGLRAVEAGYHDTVKSSK